MAFSSRMVHSFSSSSIHTALAKTPLQVVGLKGRYATTLYSASMKKNKALENTEKELNKLYASHNQDTRFSAFILDPTIKRPDKKAASQQIMRNQGVGDAVKIFFAIVADNGRIRKFESIYKRSSTTMSAHRGEILCELITAKPIDDATLREVTGALQCFVKGYQKIQVTTKVRDRGDSLAGYDLAFPVERDQLDNVLLIEADLWNGEWDGSRDGFVIAPNYSIQCIIWSKDKVGNTDPLHATTPLQLGSTMVEGIRRQRRNCDRVNSSAPRGVSGLISRRLHSPYAMDCRGIFSWFFGPSKRELQRQVELTNKRISDMERWLMDKERLVEAKDSSLEDKNYILKLERERNEVLKYSRKLAGEVRGEGGTVQAENGDDGDVRTAGRNESNDEMEEIFYGDGERLRYIPGSHWKWAVCGKGEVIS